MTKRRRIIVDKKVCIKKILRNILCIKYTLAFEENDVKSEDK